MTLCLHLSFTCQMILTTQTTQKSNQLFDDNNSSTKATTPSRQQQKHFITKLNARATFCKICNGASTSATQSIVC